MNNEFNSSYSNAPDQSESEPIVVNTVDDSDNSQNVSDFNNNVPEPKKNKSGLKAFAVIALAVVLALSAGFGGALIANRIFDNNDNNIIKNPNGDYGVIYQSTNSATNPATTEKGSIAYVAEKVSPAVVEITTETIETSSYFGQYITDGAGSGVIITENGYVLTCAHVIDGATSVNVKMSDGLSYPAKVIGSDTVTDVAVLKIEGEKFPFVVVGDSDKLIVGEIAVAIGNPLGELGGTVTNGIISALDREVKIQEQSYNLLQTNAAINPGNSGGGLFNINGELIGIVNAKSSGEGIEGLGFAIPINDALEVSEQLINFGYIKGRPRLGIYVIEITSSTDYWDLRQKYPALINYVTDTGVYFIQYDESQTVGGLQFGDRLVAIDGIAISSQPALAAILNAEY
ncbi:MAG: trypsin-like peptidase domain-containing protein, partial [Clostridia bacterium]|nr:trypsin-like peptidase domain-containing protein [Clostridia bacterium]